MSKRQLLEFETEVWLCNVQSIHVLGFSFGVRAAVCKNSLLAFDVCVAKSGSRQEDML